MCAPIHGDLEAMSDDADTVPSDERTRCACDDADLDLRNWRGHLGRRRFFTDPQLLQPMPVAHQHRADRACEDQRDQGADQRRAFA